MQHVSKLDGVRDGSVCKMISTQHIINLPLEIMDLIFRFACSFPRHITVVELVCKRFYGRINSKEQTINLWFYMLSRYNGTGCIPKSTKSWKSFASKFFRNRITAESYRAVPLQVALQHQLKEQAKLNDKRLQISIIGLCSCHWFSRI